VPTYIQAWEGLGDPLREKYPLQLVTTHARRRAHTQYESSPWLRELIQQALLMSSRDAKSAAFGMATW